MKAPIWHNIFKLPRKTMFMSLDRIVGRTYASLPKPVLYVFYTPSLMSHYLNGFLPHDIRHELIRQCTVDGDKLASVIDACVAHSRRSVIINALQGIVAFALGMFVPESSPVAFGSAAYAVVDTVYRFWPNRNGVPAENLIGMSDDEHYTVDEKIRGTLILDVPYRLLTGQLNPHDIIKGPLQFITHRFTAEKF